MARRRLRRRPGARRRCRLVSVSWLVDEARVMEIVALAEAAGFSVAVSPTVHLVADGVRLPAEPPLRGGAGGRPSGAVA